MNTVNTELLVRKSRPGEIALRESPEPPLAEGQVRVGIESFALTTNNITYAAFGEAMGYWRFFPSGREGWGIVPAWGFAAVRQSLHPGVAVGERLYGFWPMASSTVLRPARLSTEAFFDGQPHRAELHAIYNQYLRCAVDPMWRPETEDVQSLLRPLFTTSWLIDDFLADNDFFGARTVLLSSASSKTASGTAFQLSQREGVEVIGLTSPGRREFCERLGCYHRVLAYDTLDWVDSELPLVYVDFAGRGELRRAVHQRFSQLKYDAVIGNTHAGERAPPGEGADLPGPAPTFFFAPAQIKKRHTDWGAHGFAQRMADAWGAFVAKATDPAAPWFRIEHHRGGPAVQAAWTRVHGAIGHPRAGHILSLAAR